MPSTSAPPQASPELVAVVSLLLAFPAVYRGSGLYASQSLALLQTSLMLAALPTFTRMTGDAGTGGTGYPNSTTTWRQQNRRREHNHISLAGLARFARRGHHHDHVDRNTTVVRGTDRV